jgi:hypothetical protein
MHIAEITKLGSQEPTGKASLLAHSGHPKRAARGFHHCTIKLLLPPPQLR